MKKTIQIQNEEKQLHKIVKLSVSKYANTYKLLDEYDKNPESAPKYLVERKSLQKSLQSLSD